METQIELSFILFYNPKRIVSPFAISMYTWEEVLKKNNSIHYYVDETVYSNPEYMPVDVCLHTNDAGDVFFVATMPSFSGFPLQWKATYSRAQLIEKNKVANYFDILGEFIDLMRYDINLGSLARRYVASHGAKLIINYGDMK